MNDNSSDTEESHPRRRITLPASRRGRTIVGGALALVLVVAVGAVVWIKATGLPDGAVFAYGDHVVTKEDLDGRTQSLEALYGVVAPTDPAKLDRFRRDLAKSVAVSQILDDAAQEKSISIADKQARDVLDRYVDTQFGDGGRPAFVRTLGNVGTSEAAVLDEIKRQLAVGRLMDAVVGEVTIGDDALGRAFAERKAALGLPERRVVRNVVLGSRQDAEEALARLRSGDAFPTVAAELSLDASSKRSGGLLGELAKDQLERPVGDAVFTTRAGGLYGPVKGEFGWNIGRVDRVMAPVAAELGHVRDSLRETLRTEESLRRWRDWLGERIRAAAVEYAPEYRPVSR